VVHSDIDEPSRKKHC